MIRLAARRGRRPTPRCVRASSDVRRSNARSARPAAASSCCIRDRCAPRLRGIRTGDRAAAGGRRRPCRADGRCPRRPRRARRSCWGRAVVVAERLVGAPLRALQDRAGQLTFVFSQVVHHGTTLLRAVVQPDTDAQILPRPLSARSQASRARVAGRSPVRTGVQAHRGNPRCARLVTSRATSECTTTTRRAWRRRPCWPSS